MTTSDNFNWQLAADEDALLSSNQPDAHFFFTGAKRGQQLEHLLHLSRFSQLVLLVVSDDGLGKTALLKEFLRHPQEGADLAYVDASVLMDTLSVLETIARQWDLPVPIGATINHYLMAFVQYIQSGSSEGRYAIFVIDNAGQLTDETFAVLYTLFTSPIAQQVHFILSTNDHSLAQRITPLTPYRQAHVLDLQPLTEEDTLSYLEDYCAVHHIDNLVSEEEANEIYQQSQGHIQHINQLLKELLDPSMSSDEDDYPERSSKKSFELPRFALPEFSMPRFSLPPFSLPNISAQHAKYIGIAVISLAIITLLFTLNEKPTKPTTITQAVPINVQPASDKPAINQPTAATVAIETKTVVTDATEIKTVAVDTVAPTQAVAAATTQQAISPVTIETAAIANTPLTASETPAEASSKTSPAKAVEKSTPPTAAPKVIKKLPATNTSAVAAETKKTIAPKVVASSSGPYTLQVMGSFSDASITKLISSQGGNGQWTRYQTMRDGKPWFVAAYGHYPTAKAAKAGVKQLPSNLQKLNPWPRVAKDLQP